MAAEPTHADPEPPPAWIDLPPGYGLIVDGEGDRLELSVFRVEDGPATSWPVIFQRAGRDSAAWRAEVALELAAAMAGEPPSSRVEDGELARILGGFDARVPVGYAFDGFRRSGRAYVVVSVPVERDAAGRPYGRPLVAFSGGDGPRWRAAVAEAIRALPRPALA